MVTMTIVGCWLFYSTFFAASPEDNKPVTEEVMTVSIKHSKASQRSIMARFNGITKAYKSITLRPEVDGTVKKIHFQDGDFVKANEVILEFEEQDLGDLYKQAQKDLKSAQLKLQSAKTLYEKQLSSKESYIHSQSQVDKAQAVLEKALANLEKTKVRAPFDGFLERIMIKEGDYVSGMLQSILATFSVMDKLLVVVYTTPENLGIMEQASEIYVTNSRYCAKATVNFVGRIADNATKTFPVDLTIENIQQQFRIGESVKVEALYSHGRPMHYIPKSALVLTKDGELAIKVVDEQSVARRIRVIVRDEDEDGLWVSGLTEEENIITIGSAYVPDNQKVVAVLDGKDSHH